VKGTHAVSRSKVEPGPKLSLLDRLSQPDSDSDTEVFLPQERAIPREGPDKHVTQAYRRTMADLYKKSVKRDLEWLFNTRRTFDPRLDNYPQLSASVFAFGLPDMTSVNPASAKDHRHFALIMQRSLEFFDPRLQQVQIEIEPLAGFSRSLQFRINGVLMMDPAPEEVVINAVLDSSFGRYEVK
jgi:type VI secretion system protein ImpF